MRTYAGWWRILDLMREGIQEIGYEVICPQVPDEKLVRQPSLARIVSYGIMASEMVRGEAFQLVLGAPSYGCIPMMDHVEAVSISYGWNNAPAYRNRVLEPEYVKMGSSYDHSPAGDALYELGLRKSDHVIACSPYVKKTHAEVIPDARISIARWGVDVNMFTPGVKRDRFTILFSGGDPIRKGLGYLLDAYQEFADVADLWLVGCNVQVDHPSVRCFGMVPHQQMPEIVRQCHVLVLPTLEDGIALSVQESMASGVVPITTADPSEVFVDGVSGFTVPFGDVRSIRLLLERFVLMPRNEYNNLCRSSRAQAEAFTWDDFKAEFKQRIREAVDDHQACPRS